MNYRPAFEDDVAAAAWIEYAIAREAFDALHKMAEGEEARLVQIRRDSEKELLRMQVQRRILSDETSRVEESLRRLSAERTRVQTEMSQANSLASSILLMRTSIAAERHLLRPRTHARSIRQFVWNGPTFDDVLVTRVARARDLTTAEPAPSTSVANAPSTQTEADPIICITMQPGHENGTRTISRQNATLGVTEKK